MRRAFLSLFSLAMILSATGGTRYVGGDISLLPEYENAGAKYYDHDGKPIASLLPWLHEQGMNAMRVRLFVDPDKYAGSDKDANACQSVEYIIPLCKRIKDDGFALVLDFHYSDTWADPAKQWTPSAWANLTDDELYDKINEYTAGVLSRLKAEGITPDFIQPGNEISYGMLWGPEGAPENSLKKTFYGSDANWQRLGRLLKNAIKACREQCPQAKIILHTERVSDDEVMKNFYRKMDSMGVDYDIVGLSYYPYFHGDMQTLSTSLRAVTTNFPTKQIMIVETGYAYKWAVPGSKYDYSDRWSYTDGGQDAFAKELVSTLRKYDAVTGLFWWWMEYNAYGTTLSGWYNAPLFDSTTGRAASALKTICSFAGGIGGIGELEDERQVSSIWYDLSGRVINQPSSAGMYINDGKVKIVN